MPPAPQQPKQLDPPSPLPCDAWVQVERYRYWARSATLGNTLQVLGAVVLATLFSSGTPSGALLAWVVAVTVTAIARWRLAAALNAQSPNQAIEHIWRRYFLITAAVNGLVWTFLPCVLYPAAAGNLQPVITLAMAGTLSAAVPFLGATPLAFSLFVVPMGAIFSVQAFTVAGPHGAISSCLVLLFIALLFIAASRWQASLRKSLELEYQQRCLLSALDDSNRALSELATQRDLSQQADRLTGLPERQAFQQALAAAVSNSLCSEPSDLLAYLDLDQFKIINDTCGHEAGDALLQQIALRLKQEVREDDFLARLGGDEFALLFRRCPADAGMARLQRIIDDIAALRFAWDEQLFRTSASMGVVVLDGKLHSASAALSAADAACHLAKDLGRNRITYYDPDDAALLEQSRQMEGIARLETALAEHHFELCFQDIQPLQNHQGRHVEILLGKLDADGQALPPADFVPAAERYGLMPSIDRWVIERAFRFLHEHQAAGRLNDLRTCAINLSGTSLSDASLLPFVEAQLEKWQIDPTVICLEITETAAVSALLHAEEFFRCMRKRGIRFALDDFGSGLSSFAYLRDLPVDFVKIDGRFVRQSVNQAMDRAIVESITRTAQVIGLQVIAEAVETAEISALMSEIGVDYAQGYHYSRPLPLSEF